MSASDNVRRGLQSFTGVTRDQYLNCCQSILAAFADHTPIRREELIRLGTGFGGGFAGMGEACGILIGGIILISLKYGVTGDEEYRVFKDKKNACKKAVREYLTWFHNENRKIKCVDILGFEATTEEGMENYTYLKQKGDIPCYGIIERSIKHIYKILALDN